MKYIKTNEELFFGSKIPKKIIDGLNSKISEVYKTKIIHDSKDAKLVRNKRILDRVTISATTPIGQVDLVITLRAPSESKIKNLFGKNEISFVVEHNNIDRISTSKLLDDKQIPSDWGINSIQNYISNRQNIDTMSDAKAKNKQSFIAKLSTEDLFDMSLELTDILGKPNILLTDYHQVGYTIIYTCPVLFETKESYGKKYAMYTPNDKFLSIITELNALYNRLDSGFNLDMAYSISNGDISSTKKLTIMITQRKES